MSIAAMKERIVEASPRFKARMAGVHLFWQSDPEHAARLQYGWAPMAIAEVTTGFWLMWFAVKTQARSD